MGLTYTAPALLPVTLAEMMLHLRVDETAENDLVSSLIDAATKYVEEITRRQFLNATYVWTLDRFTSVLRPPRAPLSSVTSIAYTDTAGDSQTVTASDYVVDKASEPGRIVEAVGEVWPTTRQIIDAVTVTFIAGYGATAASTPEGIKAAIKLYVADLFEHREANIEARLQENIAVNSLLWQYRVYEAD